MMLAEVMSPPNTASVIVALLGVLVGLVSIASYFAARNEVIDLKERVYRMEQLVEKMRTEGSERGKALHGRVDRVNALLNRIAGRMQISTVGLEGEE